MNKKVQVSHEFLDECAENNSCMTLSGDSKKLIAKVIEWDGRLWVCVGSASRFHQIFQADLCECVLEKDYKGPPRNPEASGEDYYTGCAFRSTGKTYVITNHNVTLVPALEGKALNLYQARA